MKYFFARYIIIDKLIAGLNDLNLSDQERLHLSQLVDSSLHHAILDEILSNLGDSDKKVFLKKLQEDPENEELIEFLKPKIENIEDKIKTVSDQLISKMHKDVKEALSLSKGKRL